MAGQTYELECELNTNFVSGFDLIGPEVKQVQLGQDYDLSAHVQSHQHAHQQASLQGEFPELQINFFVKSSIDSRLSTLALFKTWGT